MVLDFLQFSLEKEVITILTTFTLDLVLGTFSGFEGLKG